MVVRRTASRISPPSVVRIPTFAGQQLQYFDVHASPFKLRPLQSPASLATSTYCSAQVSNFSSAAKPMIAGACGSTDAADAQTKPELTVHSWVALIYLAK